MQRMQMMLTAPQLRNLNNQKSFQMSHHQLINGTGGTKHVELELTPEGHHRLFKNINAGKGHRFKPHEINGGSFFGTLKKIGNVAKSVIPKNIVKDAANFAINRTPLGNNPIASSLINAGVDKAYGNGLFSSIGKVLNKIPKDFTKNLINKGLDVAGVSNPILKGVVNAGVDGAYKATGGKLVKGSAESKARMAHLRSLKGKGIGSFLKNTVKSIKNNGIRGTASNLLTEGINKATGSQLGNSLQPLINQGINKGLDRLNVGVGINPCSCLVRDVKRKPYRSGKNYGGAIVASLGGLEGYNHGNNIHGGSFSSW
jgi:hypothetical protein